MKKLSIYLSMAVIAAGVTTGLSSCSDDYAQPPVVIPEEEGKIGDGTWENPMQTWQAHYGTVVGERTSNWVTGYIVGWVDTSNGSTMKESSCVIGVPCNVNTNMVMAQYEYDPEKWAELGYTWENCISVQLPSGDVRNALNLQDNPGNFNRQVTIKGTTGQKYCGVYGVRSVVDYNWGDQGNYEEPIAEIGGSYYCDFNSSADINFYIERGWNNVTIAGGLSGWYVKKNGGDQFATCSAYLGSETAGPYENWLVTPGIEVSKMEKKTLSFVTQAGYTAPDSELTVWLLTTTNPRSCTPKQIECVIAQVPSSGFSAWTPSGEIDLSGLIEPGYDGKIYIGFKYTSSHGGNGYSSTYNVDDVNIGGADVPDSDNPGADNPSTEQKTFVKVTSVKSGHKYAMVHDGKVAIPIQANYTYGYLYVTDFQKVTEDSFTTSEANAFLFESEGDGYTIRDSYGRYLYLDETHTSFQLSAEKPEINSSWKVEYSDNHFNITNTGRPQIIDWADNYSNFSTVATDQYTNGGPELYEMQD